MALGGTTLAMTEPPWMACPRTKPNSAPVLPLFGCPGFGLATIATIRHAVKLQSAAAEANLIAQHYRSLIHARRSRRALHELRDTLGPEPAIVRHDHHTRLSSPVSHIGLPVAACSRGDDFWPGVPGG